MATAKDAPFNYDLDSETREVLIRAFLESGKGQEFQLLVVGEAGQGKSSLINALIGQELAKRGHGLKPQLKQYKLTKNEVNTFIWDSPGFGINTEEDEKLIERMKTNDGPCVDLTLFCIRMDAPRFPTESHLKTIKKLTQTFGKQFWRNCLFVLTFANKLVDMDREEGLDLEQFFSERLTEFQKKISAVLKEHAGLSNEDLKHVHVDPVGSLQNPGQVRNPYALPDREDWFLSFWMDIAECTTTKGFVALLKSNQGRLKPSCSSYQQPPADLYDHNLPITDEEFKIIEETSMKPKPTVENAPEMFNWREELFKELKEENASLFTYLYKYAIWKIKVEPSFTAIISGLLEGYDAKCEVEKQNEKA